jgi:hypothetical protein
VSQRLQLSATGRVNYERWRDAPATEPDAVELVHEVLLAIAEDGWPPMLTCGAHPVPRWPYFSDATNPENWIIARTSKLWVVVHPEAETFDFITAIHPTPEQSELTDWLPDPPEPDV